MALRHEFRRSGGATLELPLTDAQGRTHGLVDDFELRKEAPGGPVAITGTIGADLLAAYPTYFEQGVLWKVWDADDVDGSHPTGRCIGAGQIDTPPKSAGGVAQITAQGHGQEPDNVFGARTWQSRDERRMTAGDSEPHDYDQDEQIKAEVDGARIKLGWEKKTVFLRATGETTLDGDVSAGATSITVAVNAGGLADGEKIHIGDEVRTVHSSYTPGSTSIPLTSALDEDHDDGEQVYWRANNAPEEWASSLVGWWPDADIARVAFDLELTRLAPAEIEVFRATGPAGARTVVDTIDCSSGALTRAINVPSIAGTPTLIGLRLVRSQQSDENGADHAFWAIVRNLRVNDLAGNADAYTAAEVVTDIATAEGGDTTGIMSSPGVNMMPLDPTDLSDGAILDAAALVAGRYWSRRRKSDGTGVEWVFEPFAATTWNVTQTHAPFEPIGLPRYNAVDVPYKESDGVYRVAREFADPDPFPGEVIVRRIDLREPPPEDIARAFALNAADLLAEERYAVLATFSEVEDPANPGVAVPASRVQEGHGLRFTNYDDLVVPAVRLVVTDELVTLDTTPLNEGDTGHPVLDRIIAARDLALARGASQAKATLTGFKLQEPATPQGVQMGIREDEKRKGRRDFDAVLDFKHVTEDVAGNGTAIRRYIGEFEFYRYNGSAWVPVRDASGKRLVKRETVTRKRGSDNALQPAASRIVLKRLPHPHEWKVSGRVIAEDVFNEVSAASVWTTPIMPASFGPKDIDSHTLDIDQHHWRARIVHADATDTEDDGDPTLDQGTAYYKDRLLRRVSGSGGAFTQVDPPTGWSKGDRTRFRGRVHKPTGYEYRHEVKAVDAYGNESATSAATNEVGVPPAPVSAPTIAVEKGNKKGLLLTASGAYSGVHTDDDVDTVIVVATIAGRTRRPRVQLNDDGTWSHSWDGLDKDDNYDIAWRVQDRDGKRSGLSPSASGTLVGPNPPAPQAAILSNFPRKVIVRRYQTAGDKADVDEYLVEISNNGFASVYDSERSKGGVLEFAVPQNTGPYTARTSSFNKAGLSSGPVGSTNSASPDKVYSADLDRSGSLEVLGSYKSGTGAGEHLEVITGTPAELKYFRPAGDYWGGLDFGEFQTDLFNGPTTVLRLTHPDGFTMYGTLVVTGPITTEDGRLVVGTSTDTSNYIDLHNAGGIVAAPSAGKARINYRADLSPAELRVRFPNGVTKTLATDA